MSDCTLTHGEEGTIPPFLCRQCHPELNRKREQPKAPAPPVCEAVEW